MKSLAALLLAFAPAAFAHGYLASIIVDGKSYSGWHVFSHPYTNPNGDGIYVRKYKDNGPVPDFTSKDITCNVGGNVPISNFIPVNAGSQVKFQWDQWGSSHSGPVMTYIARCPNGCANFKGDSGNVWVKIDQMAYDTSKSPPWGSDMLAKQGASWTVTIPRNIPNGEYLLRHEILGLHVAGKAMGAQFYPSCAQIIISGGTGSSLPTGVALPGAYNPTDPGILAELWRINQGQVQYVAPGGPVLLR